MLHADLYEGLRQMVCLPHTSPATLARLCGRANGNRLLRSSAARMSKLLIELAREGPFRATSA